MLEIVLPRLIPRLMERFYRGRDDKAAEGVYVRVSSKFRGNSALGISPSEFCPSRGTRDSLVSNRRGELSLARLSGDFVRRSSYHPELNGRIHEISRDARYVREPR